MGKWHGVIGYAIPTEVRPGVWKDQIVERIYDGDVTRSGSRWSNPSPDSTNDNLTLNMQISIVADPFAYEKFHSMKYVGFMGTKWKVSSVDPSYPRLVLSVGGVYNG